ncbi:MAG: DUF547 domain-containing protein [Lacipirellulaceae bacterium]
MRPLLYLSLAALYFFTATSSAADRWTVGQKHPSAELVSADQIDHTAWDRLLRKYVDKQGMVNYRGWKRDLQDQQLLDLYLQTLSRCNPGVRATKPAKLALWINAYNAVTVKGILREYPTTSIRKHTAKLIGYNIWEDLLLVVGNKAYSLEDIEHKVLRKMEEPRIHFAIVCASIGCPPLLNEAYTAKKLEEQLASNSRRFFADSEKFQYDASSRVLRISPILDWFAKDFGETQQMRLQLLSPYFPEDAQQVGQLRDVRIRYLPYDWDLNEQKPKASDNR